ncbi:MAG: family 78 glycoside hydrolase catalytic domain [Petrimonas sp.]|jgi:hypothetical protein
MKNVLPHSFLILCFTSLLIFPSFLYGKDIRVVNLTSDYQENPVIVATDTPRFGWQLQSSRNGVEQTAYEIEIFDNKNRRVWKSGKIISDKSQHIPYGGKTKLNPGEKYTWRVRVWNNKNKSTSWSEKNEFRLAPDKKHLNAQWISAIKRADSNLPQGRSYHGVSETSEKGRLWTQTNPLSKRSIYLRKSFSLQKQVKDAIIYISGQGHYELSLNGEKVGNDLYNPLWSDYDKTVYYNAYDLTEELNSGDNTIGVLLGNGFYNEQAGRYKKMQVSFGPPTLFLKLDITYTDGTKEEIISDKDWKYSPSPIIFNSMYGGEDYDARLEQPGWDTPNFDDSQWLPVVVDDAPNGELKPQTSTPIREMEYFDIKSSKKIGNVYVLDMGQNLSGYPVFTVKGKKGDKIKLTVAERINDDGSINQTQSGGPYYYEYTLKGEGDEVWKPRFSYYGFRYIQVEGAKLQGVLDNRDIPIIKELKSCFVYNSAETVGNFHSSNEIFNKAHNLIVNAIKSNMQAVFTDCPHREKLGWLEQIHLNGPGLYYNFNLARFAPKIMQDIRDAQLPNGLITSIAPEYVIFDGGFRDSPEWGCAGVIFPFMYYEFYGDNSLIVEYYDVIKKYVDYLTSTAKNHIVSHGLGDWCDYREDQPYGVSHNTPIPLSATTHYYMVIDYLVQAAEMLNKAEDKAFYSDLREKVKTAFNDEFFNKNTKQYGTGSQASNSMPLFAGLVAPEDKQAVLSNLVKDIEEKGFRLSTGDVGNRYLFQVLARNGLNEVMYKMHNHNEVPGYGFQLQYGATTLTELWDPRKGASWNHFMMGQIEEWFYRSLAGINVDENAYTGFKRFNIAPQVVGDLTFVNASYITLYGEVKVNWKVDNGQFEMDVEVPVNCEAKVFLPNETNYITVKSGKYSFKKKLN